MFPFVLYGELFQASLETKHDGPSGIVWGWTTLPSVTPVGQWGLGHVPQQPIDTRWVCSSSPLLSVALQEVP